jgi:hypothetical protein
MPMLSPAFTRIPTNCAAAAIIGTHALNEALR